MLSSQRCFAARGACMSSSSRASASCRPSIRRQCPAQRSVAANAFIVSAASTKRRDKAGRTPKLSTPGGEIEPSIAEMVEEQINESNSEAFAAYCNIMGTSNAHAACASNLTLLKGKRDPAAIHGVFSAICDFVGQDEAYALILREPTALTCSVEDFQEIREVLTVALGDEDAKEAVLRNPTLLASGRLNHMVNAVPTLRRLLESEELATQALRRNSLLLGTPSDTMEGAHAKLVEIFGKEKAAAMITRHPGLLRSLPSTIGGSWELLQEILGDRETAEQALHRNSTLLKAKPSTMQGAWEMLKMIWGDRARDAAHAQLGLLRSKPQTIQEAFNVLVDLVGEDQARQMATAQPVLLQIRSKALLSNYRVLENALGFEKTIQLLALYPNSLMVRVGRLRESLRIAETVLGMQYSDHVTPSLLRMGPLRLQARVDDVLARLGAAEGMSLLRNEPALLACTERVIENQMVRA